MPSAKVGRPRGFLGGWVEFNDQDRMVFQVCSVDYGLIVQEIHEWDEFGPTRVETIAVKQWANAKVLGGPFVSHPWRVLNDDAWRRALESTLDRRIGEGFRNREDGLLGR